MPSPPENRPGLRLIAARVAAKVLRAMLPEPADSGKPPKMEVLAHWPRVEQPDGWNAVVREYGPPNTDYRVQDGKVVEASRGHAEKLPKETTARVQETVDRYLAERMAGSRILPEPDDSRPHWRRIAQRGPDHG